MKIGQSYSTAFGVLLFIAAALIIYCNYLVFLIVPNERLMGAVQRIFYFHVGAATACYVAIAVLACGSLYFLATRSRLADILASASGEVAFLFCSMVLASGMIWGHSAWNTWFSWEPRLVSFLILWLVLLAYNILRNFSKPEQTATHAAVIGIIGAINVPIVIYSIKLLPGISQLHPQVVERQGLRDPLFVSAMFYCLAGLVVLQFLLIALRVRVGILEELAQVEEKNA